MKVAMLSPLPAGPGQPPESGVAAYTVSLLNAMGRDADVTVLAQRQAPGNLLLTARVARVWSPSVLLPFQVSKAVSDVRPDLLHVQHEFNLYGGLLKGQLLTLMLLALRSQGMRTLTTIHGIVAPDDVTLDFLDRNGLPRSRRLVRAVLRTAYRTIDASSTALIVHHEYFRTVLAGEYGIVPTKIAVIPPGVAVGNEGGRSRRAKGTQNILTLGFLTGYKLPELLVGVAESDMLPDATFNFCVGVNPRITDRKYRERYAELERRVRALGSRARWNGYIPDEALASTFDEADVLALPYTECVSVSAVASLAYRSGTRICHSRPLRPLFGAGPLEFELTSESLAEALVRALSMEAASPQDRSSSWHDAAHATVTAWNLALTAR